MLKKSIVTTFIFIFLFILGCESIKDLETAYNKKVETEILKSDESNETIFGFMLGCTKSEAENTAKQLVKDGKLKIDEKGNYIAENFFADNTEATLSTEFYKNKLVKIDIKIAFRGHNKGAGAYNSLFLQLIEDYTNKYGKPDLDDRSNKLKYSSDWVKGRVFWIQNNRELILMKTNLGDLVHSVTLDFIDKRIEKDQENDPEYQKEKADQLNRIIESHRNDSNVEVKNSPLDGSVSQVKKYLKENLKNPKSFDAIEWSEVNKLPNGNYTVRCKYRAENSFGGLVISNQVFTINPNGEVIDVIDL